MTESTAQGITPDVTTTENERSPQDILEQDFNTLPEEAASILKAILKIQNLLKERAKIYSEIATPPQLTDPQSDNDPSGHTILQSEAHSTSRASYEERGYRRSQQIENVGGQDSSINLKTQEREGLSWNGLPKREREEILTITPNGYKVVRSTSEPTWRKKKERTLTLESDHAEHNSPISKLESHNHTMVVPEKDKPITAIEKKDWDKSVKMVTTKAGKKERIISVDDLEGQTLVELLNIFHAQLLDAADQHSVKIPEEVRALPKAT